MLALALTLALAPEVAAFDLLQDGVIPHSQDRVPNPPRSPQEALAAMEVAPDLVVELVCAEPLLVNPIAMAFDEHGRVWVTESVEYPRLSSGPGRDRVKVLEDRDGDGTFETATVFADGLNIPSGIALGYGGVWVANAPDLLFMTDVDGDLVADTREVVVTGFGREDTHELPNSLTWGPDGWLYGLNGVYNRSRVEQRGEVFDFTCAMFRVHPGVRDTSGRRRFQIFARGTSNPWGIAFDDEGSAFVSACVIDHLWHIVEGGDYQRQSGANEPFAWVLGSIVDHRHQRAAYCGLHWFDADGLPERLRRKLVMGNLHGGCLNVDELERRGSTYHAKPLPDLLTANDAWFMPIVQKTGPDGCLYVLDWYDRYHCYQDARRDPDGIDRGRGRLYRIRAKGPRPAMVDLAGEDSSALIARLGGPNDHLRWTAQRLLAERREPDTLRKLERIVLDAQAPPLQRRHALWTIASAGSRSGRFQAAVLDLDDPVLRAFGVRMASAGAPALAGAVAALARDPDPRVALQVATGLAKLGGSVSATLTVARNWPDDPTLQAQAWRALRQSLDDGDLEPNALDELAEGTVPAYAELHRRAADYLAVHAGAAQREALVRSLGLAWSSERAAAADITGAVIARIPELDPSARAALVRALTPTLDAVFEGPAGGTGVVDAALLAVALEDPRGFAAARAAVAAPATPFTRRHAALAALVTAEDTRAVDALDRALAARAVAAEGAAQLIEALGPLAEPRVVDVLLARYPALDPPARAAVVRLACQRAPWARALMRAVGEGRVPAGAVSTRQARGLAAFDDGPLNADLDRHWGAVRDGHDPAREKVIARVRRLVRSSPGDPQRGLEVFGRACAQCHTLYGEGATVGPDLTGNGRGSFEALLSNVLDPNLVVGSSYRARIVLTQDGRLLTGLVQESTPERLVLLVEGGKSETVPRADIAVERDDSSSMMPEGLETSLSDPQLADLFALLVLDKPPGDPAARPLFGATPIVFTDTEDPAAFAALVREVAPGFQCDASGDDGVGLEESSLGRDVVLRIHPLSKREPAILHGRFALPDGPAALKLAAGHHPKGDWRLVVRVEDDVLLDTFVGPETAREGWLERSVDLSAYAGRSVRIAVENHATGWSHEYGYFARVEVSAGE